MSFFVVITAQTPRFTAEFWVKIKGPVATSWVMSSSDGAGWDRAVTIKDSRFGQGPAAVSGATYSSPTPVVTDVWHHIVAVWDRTANVVKTYVNGSPVATTSDTASSPTLSYIIVGGNSEGAALNGWLKHARFYNVALTNADVGKNFQAGRDCSLPSTGPQNCSPLPAGQWSWICPTFGGIFGSCHLICPNGYNVTGDIMKVSVNNAAVCNRTDAQWTFTIADPNTPCFASNNTNSTAPSTPTAMPSTPTTIPSTPTDIPTVPTPSIPSPTIPTPTIPNPVAPSPCTAQPEAVSNGTWNCSDSTSTAIRACSLQCDTGFNVTDWPSDWKPDAAVCMNNPTQWHLEVNRTQPCTKVQVKAPVPPYTPQWPSQQYIRTVATDIAAPTGAILGLGGGGTALITGSAQQLALLGHVCGDAAKQDDYLLTEYFDWLKISHFRHADILLSLMMLYMAVTIVHGIVVFVIMKVQGKRYIDAAGPIRFPWVEALAWDLVVPMTVFCALEMIFKSSHSMDGTNIVGILFTCIVFLIQVILMVALWREVKGSDNIVPTPFEQTPSGYESSLSPMSLHKLLPKWYWCCPNDRNRIRQVAYYVNSSSATRVGWLYPPLNIISVTLQVSVPFVFDACTTASMVMSVMSTLRLLTIVLWRPYNDVIKNVLAVTIQCLVVTISWGVYFSSKGGTVFPPAVDVILHVLTLINMGAYFVWALLSAFLRSRYIKQLWSSEAYYANEEEEEWAENSSSYNADYVYDIE